MTRPKHPPATGQLLLWLLHFAFAATAAFAAVSPKQNFSIPASAAEKSLKLLSEQSGRQVLFPTDVVVGVRTRAVAGEMTAAEALQKMLAGTALVAIEDGETGALTVRRERPPEKRAQRAAPVTASDRPVQPIKPEDAPSRPETPGAGGIKGRIQNVSTGDYLDNARVTIEGTNLTALTNDLGEYHLAYVPAGDARITVFYSGLAPFTATITVVRGLTVTSDFNLKGSSVAGETIRLGAFTVQAGRETSEAAIATNEQRFAANTKTVMSSDQFGEQSEGNVAEFLKFMPGVSIDYVGQDARTASVRGMPPETTIVTANGNQLASAASSSASRVFEFEQVSINDVARIEFNKTLVPDMPAEGIGGTINLITKSAFQRSRPELRYRTYLNFNTSRLDLRRMHGPSNKAWWHYRPGFDFTYVKPVNANFGFTLSGAVSSKFNPQHLVDTTYTLNPDPATGAENPYLRSFTMQDSPKMTDRYSGRISMDWRFAPNDVLTIGFSEQFYRHTAHGRRWIVNAGADPVSFSPQHVQGRPGAGVVSFNGNTADKHGLTWTQEFRWMHNGPVWRMEMRGARSHASNYYSGMDHGRFHNHTLTMGSINAAGTLVSPTVHFRDTGNYLPEVTAELPTGPVDPQNVDHFFLTSGTELFRRSTDMKNTLYFHARRIFDIVVPVTVKAGGDVRESIRDIRENIPTFTFVGPDGRLRSGDDAAVLYDIADYGSSAVDPPYGLPNFKLPSMFRIYEVFEAHRDWWTRDPAAELRDLVSRSKHITETITSGFVRLDAAFFENRLRMTGGARYQNYRMRAEAGEVDTLQRYVHDEEGNLVFDPNTNRPIVLTGGTTDITAATNVERGKLTRGSKAGVYPSFNASYRLGENLQLRAGYAHSVNYPNLSQVAAVTTISDITAATRRVTVNSPLAPWFGRNYDLDLEYYSPDGGTVSFSVFRKEITNFVNQRRLLAGTPEAQTGLDQYGYGELFPLNYEVLERFNGGEATFSGWEFDLRQRLDRYVPGWGRGLTVFFNAAYKAAPKTNGADLAAQSQRLWNWGAFYSRGRFVVNVKVNHVPEPKRSLWVPTATTHRSSRTFVDLDASMRVWRRTSIFLSGANVLSQSTESYFYTTNTPEFARRRNHSHYGVNWVVGIKGQF